MQDLATLMVGPVSKQDRVGLGQTTYIRKSYTSDWPASDIEYQAKKKPDKAVEYAHFALGASKSLNYRNYSILP